MNSVPFTQCCKMLGVDAKTLRQWLKTSSLALHTHPTDARIRCLTSEQVQQLATSHHRCIKQDAASTPEQLSAAQAKELPKPTREQLEVPFLPVQSGYQLPPTCLSGPDLVQSLFSLQATVASA